MLKFLMKYSFIKNSYYRRRLKLRSVWRERDTLERVIVVGVFLTTEEIKIGVVTGEKGRGSITRWMNELEFYSNFKFWSNGK